MGLAITKRFCEIMGGKVTVESELGTGSTFVMWLPADAARLPSGERPAAWRSKTAG